MAYSPMQLAEVFLKTGELNDAWDALNQQLQAHPDDEEARRLRAMLGLRLGADYYLQALTDSEALHSINGEDLLRHSVILEKLGRVTEAIQVMQSAHEQFPAEERLTERLLSLFVQQQRYNDCLALIRQQMMAWRWLEREGDILVLMGDDRMATARYGLALAQLESFADTMRPDYLASLKARILLARAHAYRRLEQTEVARDHYHQAQALLPDDPAIQFNLGLLIFLEGDTTRAQTICQNALDHAPVLLAESMRTSLQEDTRYSSLQSILL